VGDIVLKQTWKYAGNMMNITKRTRMERGIKKIITKT
jgi:hypothetical protein